MIFNVMNEDLNESTTPSELLANIEYKLDAADDMSLVAPCRGMIGIREIFLHNLRSMVHKT